MAALENTSTFPIIPKILCFACALLWLVEKLWVLMPQPLSCGPWILVVTGLMIAEGILVLSINSKQVNINYKQLNIPLRSDSHVPFSGAAQWGSLGASGQSYPAKVLHICCLVLPMKEYPYGHLPKGLLVQGPNAVPLHMPGNSVRAAAEADRLCFALAQTASLGSRAYKALPNEGKRSWRVIF